MRAHIEAPSSARVDQAYVPPRCGRVAGSTGGARHLMPFPRSGVAHCLSLFDDLGLFSTCGIFCRGLICSPDSFVKKFQKDTAPAAKRSLRSSSRREELAGAAKSSLWPAPNPRQWYRL
jgi:hypothetical protein